MRKIKTLNKTEDGSVYTLWDTPDGEFELLYTRGMMDLLAADLGDDAAQYESLMAEVAATYVPPTPLSIEERIAIFDAALVNHLDATARERRYDNRITCALRAGYPGPFQAEGIAFASWMDQCNALAYSLLAEVVAGTRPMPENTQALIDLLPPMVWPPAVVAA